MKDRAGVKPLPSEFDELAHVVGRLVRVELHHKRPGGRVEYGLRLLEVFLRR